MRFKHLVVFPVVLALGTAAALTTRARPAAASAGVPTSIGSSNNPSHLGEGVTFSATVQGIVPNLPLGGVIFLDNGVPMNAPALLVPNFGTFCKCIPDGSSTAQFSTSSLSGGTHLIVATALSQYGPSASAPLVQTVQGATTKTTVTAAPSPPTVFGQGVTFTATIVANA
ncbi:MAG: Ig-like domain-containing protein, partial [Actinomycetota bacterium]|nr:Ig-like domain-containing protein [Actinomycetota bacterium]